MNGSVLPAGVKRGISSAPDLVMGLAFLAVWIDPTALGEHSHRYFVTVMLLEFITIHSSAFMGWALFAGKSMIAKVLRTVGLGIFYSLFIMAFSSENGEWWPLWTFWLLILNRMLTVLVGDGGTASRQVVMMASWGWSVLSYLLAVFITVILPVPAFGWSPEFLGTVNETSRGLWVDEPQRLLAAGFLYFTAVSLFEFFSYRVTDKFSDIDPKIPLWKERP
jgi:hypothetical protein